MLTTSSLGPLLAAKYQWDGESAAELVLERIVAVPPGHSWKKPKAGSDKLRE